MSRKIQTYSRRQPIRAIVQPGAILSLTDNQGKENYPEMGTQSLLIHETCSQSPTHEAGDQPAPIPDAVSQSPVKHENLLDRVKQSLQHSRLCQIKRDPADLVERRLSHLRIDGSEQEVSINGLLRYLHQDSPKPFEAWLAELLVHMPLKVQKLGESSFCEVFFGGKQDCQQIAIKIIPLLLAAADPNVSPEPVPVRKAMHEARVQSAITGLAKHRKYCIPPGYTGFSTARKYPQPGQLLLKCRMTVVSGPYPELLVEKWDEWNLAKPSKSENTRPDHYDASSHFLVIEMDFGGQDLESFRPQSPEQIKSIMLQLAHACQLAEVNLEFEHRDL